MSEDETRRLSRREFLRTSSAAAVAVGIGGIGMASDSAQAQKAPASERIRLGVIGLGGRGTGVMRGFMNYPDCEIGAVCDLHDGHLAAGLEAAGGKANAYKDYRKLLEQKDLDAVLVTTPPHWHPLISIAACQAGKDVYCEKPISRYPAEAIAMAKAARDNKRVTQVGTQIHAGENFRRCVEIVRSGMLGKIHNVRVVCTMNEYPGGCGKIADSKPPAGLDWDGWCGPAPLVPFNEARFTVHRYFRDYVGSWLNELGPHIVDLAFWAMDPGQPKSVMATGGRFVADDVSDIPDTVDVLWEFEGFTMTWMNMCGNSFNFDFGGPPDGGRRLGVIFHGTKGTLLGDYGTHKIVSEGNKLDGVPVPEPSIPPSPGHDREFLDAIKSREQPLCNFDYHMPMAVALNLGHVALDSGRRVQWDAGKGEVVGDKEAAAFAKPDYRKPYKFPKV